MGRAGKVTPSLSLLAHSLLPPCMTTVLRVLACRSGRVAQVPFSSACFWRGLHYCRTTSSVWVGLAYAAVVYACSCERAALREVYSMMFWKHTMVGTAH